MLLFKSFIVLTRALRNGGQQMSARMSDIGGGGIWSFLIIGGGTCPSSMVHGEKERGGRELSFLTA